MIFRELVAPEPRTLVSMPRESRIASSKATWEDIFGDLFGGARTKSGVRLDTASADSLSAVFACVRVISETIATLPCKLYEIDGRSKTPAKNHPLYQILTLRPNPEMTAATFWEVWFAHGALRGNAFAEIQRDGGGRIIGLWPLPPDKVEIQRMGADEPYPRQKVLLVTLENGETKPIPPGKYIHVPFFSRDGICGRSPIGVARETVGLALAAEEFGARFFGQGANPSLVVTHPGSFKTTEGRGRVLKMLRDAMSGLTESHRLALLEEGMQIEKIGLSQRDSQFLETRKFQKREIASLFRMQAHKIADLEDAHFTNIEEQNIEFVTDTLRPYLVRAEQTIHWDLLTEPERDRYFPRWIVEGLLRGDQEKRAKYYSTGRQWGWLSVNDILELEDRNPIEGGDEYLQPLNMAPAGEADGDDQRWMLVYAHPDSKRALPPAGGDPEPTENRLDKKAREQRSIDARFRLQEAETSILRRAFERILGRESGLVRQLFGSLASGKIGMQELLDRLREFYDGELPERFIREFREILIAYSELIAAEVALELDVAAPTRAELESMVDDYLTVMIQRHASRSQGEILGVVTDQPEDLFRESIEQMLERWTEERPATAAAEEAVRSGGAFARFAYIVVGVILLRWVAQGSEPCPLCSSLDGRVVGIDQPFVDDGDVIAPEGVSPLKVRGAKTHPPLHKGCECVIAPG